MNLVVHPQRRRGVNQGFIAVAVKRLGEPRRGNQPGRAHHLAIDFQHEGVAFFALPGHITVQGGNRLLDALEQILPMWG